MPSQCFRTKDISEASALLTAGQKLLGLQKSEEGNFFYFLFQDTHTAEKISEKYWSGQLQVDARQFALSLRLLKDRVFRDENEFRRKKTLSHSI